MRVAQTAAASTRDEHSRAVVAHVGDELVRVAHQRAERHGDDDVIAILAVAIVGAAWCAVWSVKATLVAEVEQRRPLRVTEQVDRTAASTIAACGPAARHVLLAPEGDHAVAAVTGMHDDVGFVYEHRSVTSREKRKTRIAAGLSTLARAAARSRAALLVG
jgi:hypothetical protein